MLSEASSKTKAKKEEADTMEGVTVIAPTIQRKLTTCNLLDKHSGWIHITVDLNHSMILSCKV